MLSMKCPKCGLIQMRSAVCKKCGASVGKTMHHPGSPPRESAHKTTQMEADVGQSETERRIIGFIAGIAILMFFFPLVSFQAPIVGDIGFSGYDVITRLNEKLQGYQERRPTNLAGSNEPQAKVHQERGGEEDLPISVKMAWLIPLAITGAFLCALVVFLGAWLSLQVPTSPAGGGALLGIIAIIHLKMFNSDVHGVIRSHLKASANHLQGNPFAGLAELAVNAFQIRPGIGLYILTSCLTIAAFFAYYGTTSRPRSSAQAEREEV